MCRTHAVVVVVDMIRRTFEQQHEMQNTGCGREKERVRERERERERDPDVFRGVHHAGAGLAIPPLIRIARLIQTSTVDMVDVVASGSFADCILITRSRQLAPCAD
jgi:hypothetical protein